MTLSAFGMNLHAATTDGRDRKQLERICRYLLRPPFAHDAVTALPGGRVLPNWRSGPLAAKPTPSRNSATFRVIWAVSCVGTAWQGGGR